MSAEHATSTHETTSHTRSRLNVHVFVVRGLFLAAVISRCLSLTATG